MHGRETNQGHVEVMIYGMNKSSLANQEENSHGRLLVYTQLQT